jgi:hypothetical protein
MDTATRPGRDDLVHHGVKGMKWGVRHDPGHEGEQAKTKVINKADKAFNKSFQGGGGWVKIQNEFAHHINPMLDQMNSSPQFKGKNMWNDPKLHEQYMKKYDKLVDNAAKLTSESLGMNASGTKQIKVTRSGSGEEAHWTAELVDVQHADMSPSSFKIVPKFDANGFILSFSIEPDVMAQGESVVADFLAHFGVKGMHWGQHKNPSAAETAAAAAVLKERAGKIKATSKKFGPDIQAVRAGFAKPTPTKQTHNEVIAKVGGLHNISDHDLRLMLNRLDMEQKYSKILHEDRQKRIDGGKAALRVLGEIGKIALPVLLGAVAANAASGGFRGGAAFKVPVVNPHVIEGVARTLSRFPQGK